MTPSDRQCSDCSAPISSQARTGRCRLCALAVINRNPESRAKAARTYRQMLKDNPAAHARLVEATTRARRHKLQTDPAYAEKFREVGRRLFATGLGHAAQPKGSAIRKAVGQKLSDQRLGQWCPREYRALYQEWRRIKGKGAREARRQVEKKMAEDKAALLALSPFERQLEMIRRGAGIIEVRPISRSVLSHSLYGNGSAMCLEAAF